MTRTRQSGSSITAPAVPSTRSLQRKCACEEGRDSCPRCAQRIQRRSRVDGPARDAPPDVDAVLGTPGRPLAPSMRTRMEAALGHDFSSVRVHSDRAANASAEALDAHAYTVGHHVVLGNPGAEHGAGGPSLMAHELAHVVQQSRGGVPAGVDSDARLEAEADRAADAVTRGGSVALREASVPHVARQAKRKRSTTTPGIVEATGSPGLVVLKVRGEVIAVISYSAVAGTANFDTYHDRDREGATVVTPADSRASFTLGPSYTRRQQAGELSFSDVASDLEWDATGEPGAASTATEHVGRVYRLWVRSEPAGTPEAPKGEVHAANKAPISAAAKKPAAAAPTFEVKDGKTLADESSTLVSLDEDKLAKALLAQVRHGQVQAVDQALDAIGTTNRDDVAVAFCAGATDEDLERLATNEAGKRVLLRLYDELTSGHLGDDEKEQADRIMKARAQTIDPAKVLGADQKAPVIPFSTLGFTKLSSASLTVKRLPNGKIWVRSHMKREHWKDAKRMPTSTFAFGEGAEFDPDQIVGLYLYDEGGKTIYRPAIYLLQLGNQEDTKAATMAGEAVFTGLTMGLGGEAVAGAKVARGVWAARGATALRVADTGAAVIGALGVLINDHRGLILEHFGADGQAFLDAWQKVETVTAIYGMGRGAVAGAQALNDLRKAFGAWKARRAKLPSLSVSEGEALDALTVQTESVLKEAESARLKRSPSATPDDAIDGAGMGDQAVAANPHLFKDARPANDVTPPPSSSRPAGGDHSASDAATPSPTRRDGTVRSIDSAPKKATVKEPADNAARGTFETAFEAEQVSNIDVVPYKMASGDRPRASSGGSRKGPGTTNAPNSSATTSSGTTGTGMGEARTSSGARLNSQTGPAQKATRLRKSGPVDIDPMTGVPRQVHTPGGVTVGPAFRTFEEALAARAKETSHITENILRDKDQKIIATWWEVSESQAAKGVKGVGRLGDTEQKALTRVRLEPGMTLEIRGQHPPCTVAGGCDTALQDVAERTGSEIVYRTFSGQVTPYPRDDF